MPARSQIVHRPRGTRGSSTGTEMSEEPESGHAGPVWRPARVQRSGPYGTPSLGSSIAYGHAEPADMRANDGAFDRTARNPDSAFGSLYDEMMRTSSAIIGHQALDGICQAVHEYAFGQRLLFGIL